MGIEAFRVVEWSQSQKCFHVESLLEMLQSNRRVFRGESMTDYLPIGIFEKSADLERFMEKAYQVRDEKRGIHGKANA